MNLSIEKKVAIITGAGKGIGRAVALSLAAEGVSISINDIDEEAGLVTIKEVEALGVDGILIKGDVSKEKEVKELFKETYDEYGHIDILINNAGISPKLPFYEITTKAFS